MGKAMAHQGKSRTPSLRNGNSWELNRHRQGTGTEPSKRPIKSDSSLLVKYGHTHVENRTANLPFRTKSLRHCFACALARNSSILLTRRGILVVVHEESIRYLALQITDRAREEGDYPSYLYIALPFLLLLPFPVFFSFCLGYAKDRVAMIWLGE